MRTRWVPVAAAMFCCGWGGNQFTPLLVMYKHAGYSALTVDVLLGAYVLGLVPGLLLSGGLSGRYGRRPVMLLGTAASLLGSLLLALGADGLGWLVAGRLVSGVAVGAAMAVGSTWVKELTDGGPVGAADLGTRRAALWLTLGLGTGSGVAGALAQWGPWPMALPYLAHAALAAVSLAALPASPETRRGGAFRPGPRRARTGTPGDARGARHPRFRRVILPMAPWIFGSLGVAYATMPQLVGDRLGSWSLAYSTLLTLCALGAGVGIQPVAKRLDRATSARAVVVALAVVCAGLLCAASAAALGSPWAALATALVLGAGYGIAVVSGLLELQRLARPTELAELTGVYYALAYLGFLLPTALTALSDVAGYPTLLASLAVVALAGAGVVLRYSRAHLPAAGL